MMTIPEWFSLTIVSSTLLFLALVLTTFFYAKKVAVGLLTAVVLVGWFAAVLTLGKKGFFVQNPLFAPNIVLGFIFLFVVLQALHRAKAVQKVLLGLPMSWLIAIQTYRIVGYGFITLYSMKLLPGTFAFPAGIGDMVIGISAPFVAFAYARKKSYGPQLARIWNVAGIADLILAYVLGTLSFPRPVQVLPTSVSTELFSLYPLVIIPLFAVPLAFFLHLLCLQKLLRKEVKV